jgi:hypothetical protein
MSPKCDLIAAELSDGLHFRPADSFAAGQAFSFVDWRYGLTGNPETDFEVAGTHIGLAFQASVSTTIANRLAAMPRR